MSLWQTQSWQDMLVASWQTQEYFVIEQDIQSPDSKESGFETKIFVEKRRVSLWEYWLFLIGFEGQVGERLEENLQELCKEENCLFVQIEILDYSADSFLLLGENIWDFKAWYYKKFIPPYTAVIDLEKSEDEILSAMKQKGRYNIKLAAKKWVEVKRVEKSLENIKIFHMLMQETTSRDNFTWNTLSYYEVFLQQETSSLFFAYHEEEVIAAGIFIQHKEVMYYYYGASSSHKRNLMAPYLLQWEAIRFAKAIWCQIYDFLGIASPDEYDSPLMWVTDFKLKLTPDTRNVSESSIIIHKPIKYKMIQALKYFKK